MSKKNNHVSGSTIQPRPAIRPAHRVKGMKDIQPGAYAAWDFLLQSAFKLADFHGFERIDTPVLEVLVYMSALVDGRVIL